MENTIEKIGGNYVVLCWDRQRWYLHLSRHFATIEDARLYKQPGRADHITRWICERTETISDDGTDAVVEYAITNNKGDRIGSVEIAWTRGGEPIYNTMTKGDFAGYGAGLGYSGSDYATDVRPYFVR